MAEDKNRFERHTKKILFAVVFIFLALAVGITEYVLESSMPEAENVQKKRKFKRYIRFREHQPDVNRKLRAKIKAIERRYGLRVENLEEKKYRLRTDEYGFIGPTKVYDSPDLEIVFLGGSTTECIFVDEDMRFPYRAGALLSERMNKKINAYNAGFRGNNIMHSLSNLLVKVLPLHPDAVVMMHVINDVNILLFSDTYWNDHPSRSLIVTASVTAEVDTTGRFARLWETVRETVFPGISSRLSTVFSDEEPQDEFAAERGKKHVNTNVNAKDFEANLVAFIGICRAHGILPILMTQFNRFKDVPDEITRKNMDKMEADWGVDYVTYKRLNDQFNEIVRKVAREHRTPLVDLDAGLPKENTYIYDIVHLNTPGSKRVGEIIAETLSQHPEFLALVESKSQTNGK